MQKVSHYQLHREFVYPTSSKSYNVLFLEVLQCAFCLWYFRMCKYRSELYVNVFEHPGSLHNNFGAPWADLWWFLRYSISCTFLPHSSHWGPLPIPCFTHMCWRKARRAKNEAEQSISSHLSFSAPWALLWWSAKWVLFVYSFSQPGSAQGNLTFSTGRLLVVGFNFILLTWDAACWCWRSRSKSALTGHTWYNRAGYITNVKWIQNFTSRCWR